MEPAPFALNAAVIDVEQDAVAGQSDAPLEIEMPLCRT